MISGKYNDTLQLTDGSGRVPLLIPKSGPWKAGRRNIYGATRLLMFHCGQDEYELFCQTLTEAMDLARGHHHNAAEALWIKRHFAIVSCNDVSLFAAMD